MKNLKIFALGLALSSTFFLGSCNKENKEKSVFDDVELMSGISYENVQ